MQKKKSTSLYIYIYRKEFVKKILLVFICRKKVYENIFIGFYI